MSSRSLQPLPVGFHGDRHLLRLIDLLAARAHTFLETGSNVGSTLGYVARRFPALDCISCEPDPAAHAVAAEHACVRPGVALHRETSIGTAATRNGTLDRLSLGSEELLKVAVQVVERRLANADLVLGTDVLSRYGVILDLSDPAYLVLDPAEGGATPES